MNGLRNEERKMKRREHALTLKLILVADSSSEERFVWRKDGGNFSDLATNRDGKPTDYCLTGIIAAWLCLKKGKRLKDPLKTYYLDIVTRECWKLCFLTFFSGTNYNRNLDSLRCTRTVGKIIELFKNDKAEAFFSWKTFALLRCIYPVTKQRRQTNCSAKQFIGKFSLTAANQFTILQRVFSLLLGRKYDEDDFYFTQNFTDAAGTH